MTRSHLVALAIVALADNRLHAEDPGAVAGCILESAAKANAIADACELPANSFDDVPDDDAAAFETAIKLVSVNHDGVHSTEADVREDAIERTVIRARAIVAAASNI